MDSADSSGIIGGLVGLVFGIVTIVAMWKMYVKAGRPGWASIIPFYNLYVLLKIAGKPGWWMIFYFIPIANLVIHLLVSIAVAKVFNKGAAFGIFLLWLLSGIGYLILGFGKATYKGVLTSPPAPPPLVQPLPTLPSQTATK